MRGHSVTQARRVSRSVHNRTLARAMRNALLAVCVLLPVLAESTGCGLNQYAYAYLQVVIQNLICQSEYIGTYDMMWGESKGGFPVYKKQNENKYLFKSTGQNSCECWVLTSTLEYYFSWKVTHWWSGNAKPGSISGREMCPPGATEVRESILLTNELSTCRTCPSFSNSPFGSASACTCNAGYTGANGGTCNICAAGTYKIATGDAACTVCPADTYNDGSYNIQCNTCPPNTVSSEGSISEESCLCNPGYYNQTELSQIDMAQSCGVSENQPCALLAQQLSGNGDNPTATGFYAATPLTNILDGSEDTYCRSSTSTSYTDYWIRIDFGMMRDISSFTVRNIPYAFLHSKLNGVQVRVGSSVPTSAVTCAQLTSDLVQTHNCASTTRYLFLYHDVNSIDIAEIKVYESFEILTCGSCLAGTAKDTVGNNACAACPADSYNDGSYNTQCNTCPTGSSSPKGSTAVTDCTCNAGYTRDDGGSCIACVSGKYKIT